MILGIPSKDLHLEIVKGPNGIGKPIQTAFGNGQRRIYRGARWAPAPLMTGFTTKNTIAKTSNHR
jgi:hypothetical protein